MPAILVLRPQPGASETVVRAAARGLATVAAPLFRIVPLAWQAPEPAAFDAIVLTSANAARHGGGALAAFRALPCFAVGAGTAAAARAAGFDAVTAGEADAARLFAKAAEAGARRIFHPCGRDHVDVAAPGIGVVRRAVYAAEPVDMLSPAARSALLAGGTALLHSPRAAALFRRLVEAAGLSPDTIAVAALSPAVAAAAGEGWQRLAVAGAPNDEALLEVAAGLCKTAAPDRAESAR